MNRPFLVLFYLMLCYSQLGTAQVQPFSRKDSAMLTQALTRYDLASKGKKYKEAAYSLNEVAFLYWDHNNYNEAISYYEKSLEYNKKVGNENGIAMISNNLGMLHSDVENYDKALEYFSVTLATRRANKESAGIISALINISVIKNSQGKYEESIAALEEAMLLARETNDLDQMQSCYAMLAETYQKAGDPEKSLYYFEFYRSFNDLRNKKKIENIEVALEEERTKKESIEREQQLVTSQLEVKKGEIEALQGKISEADGILADLNLQLDAKNMQLKLAQQENEIYALKAQRKQELLEEENQRRQKNILVAILVIIFLVIVSAILFYSSRRIRAKNQLLSEGNSKILSINKELTGANHVKNTLFSIIGHDLKSPLAQLEQTFALLDQDLLNDDERELFFDEIRKGLKQSNLLLENLLVWAKNQMHGSTIKLGEFVLEDVIEESVFVLESVYKAKNIQLEREYNHSGTIYSDENMIKLVVRNLGSNAIKFTQRDGLVRISTGMIDNYVYIKVEDSGVGMTQEQMDKLFDHSTNNTTYGTEQEKGTGIGLKLCKQFIDAIEGEIKVDSTIDNGTTFTVFLPNNKPHSTSNEEETYHSNELMLAD